MKSIMLHFQPSGWLLLSSAIHVFAVIASADNTLKVCTKSGLVHEVSSSKCSRGAWTSLPVDVDCVCASGLWVLSESYCDKSFYVIASRNPNQCFQISHPVRRFLSLSQKSGIETGMNYHFSGNLDSFNEFATDLNVQDPPEVSYVISFNETKNSIYLRHEEGISSKFWQKCFKPSENPESLTIVQSGTASFLSSTTDCDDLRETIFGYGKTNGLTWDFHLGSVWHPKDGVIKFSESCSSTCGQAKSTSGRSMSKKKQTVEEDSTRNSLKDSVEYVASEDDYDLVPDDDSNDDNDTDIFTEKMLDNGRDTIRVIHYLKKWIVHNIPGPKVQYKEYQYMQLARIIFLKSCPYADGHTLTNFIRIFRFLIYEAFKKFPDKYPGTTDNRVHNRIVESLRRCFSKVEPYKIEYNEKACSLPDGTQPIKSIADSKSQNYSSRIEAPESDGLNFKTGTDSDVALESAWKLMLHAHYQCADEFKEHPEDLSTMYVKLQEFLISPRIIFRWENPGDYLNKVYGFLHPGFKKDQFAQTVDACVNAAKESSDFGEWLRRPKDKQDYNHKSVVGRSMVMFGAQGKGTPTLFDGKGYCVKKFEDPLIWTEFDKSVNAKC